MALRQWRGGDGQWERVGTVTETAITFIARTEGPSLTVLWSSWPFTHHSWKGQREREREREGGKEREREEREGCGRVVDYTQYYFMLET